jgi:hypothetical protein
MVESIVEGLMYKDVVVLVQSSDSKAEVKIKGRMIGYSDGWAEPELLLIQDERGEMVLVQNWNLIGEVIQ